MLRRLEAYQSAVPLLLRLGVGLTFFFAGLSKVMGGTAGVAGFFGKLGIPLPGVMGPFISYLELLGGLALILGLLTRVFGLLFICDMLVAILAAKLPAAMAAKNIADGWPQLRAELMLLVGSASLAILGAGLFSVDAALLGEKPSEYEEPVRARTTA